jgi:CheY-like chemotaxis protein/HPt (histidine-containing phosphotransfer) domain-containing protein
MLASWRMTPTVVSDAATALRVLREAADSPRPFDAVISDCQMPVVDGFTLARRLKRDRRLVSTPVVMLTSIGDPQDVARLRKIGVDAYLSKPVKHSDLLDALVTIFGVSTRQAASTRRTGRARTGPLRVLVAEDNLVNRKLITRLLQKRGHRIVAVDNGHAAVVALTAPDGKPFDAVLMDVQMPQMNGLEATMVIRRYESSRGTHVPIIAVTAHAMAGDRERCLAAGMDGYLAKPIDVNELISTVESAAVAQPQKPAAAAARTAPITAFASKLQVFDAGLALANAAGDRKLLRDVVRFFRSDYPGTLRRLHTAIKKHDADALRFNAHALKGALATVGSPAGREIAFKLEQIGLSGEISAAASHYASLRNVISDLEHKLKSEGLIAAPRKSTVPAARSRAPSGKRRVHAKDSRRRR